MSAVTSLMLVGVGGQGTILVSTILSQGLVASGRDVKMSEVHGMAQRGGSVSTEVRFGEVVHSPIIGRGGADLLVAFEAMEALRWIGFLRPAGRIIVNDQQIPSAPILMGRLDYPDGVIATLRAKADTTVIKAFDIAASLGNPRALNVVLLGALVEALELTDIAWEPIIAATVKAGFVALNLAACRAGRDAWLRGRTGMRH
jgi:indolepyruvate ferredoxin oxidoreductase beta subunit